MAAPDVPVDLGVKFASFADQWSPKTVGEMNDVQVKVVKAEGEFVWQTHDDIDEFFLVRKGRLTIEMRGRDAVVLEPGQFFVVPRGVEHRPVAEAECEVILLEPKGVVNTGGATGSDLTAEDEWI